jgi:hypothetical protein
MNIDIDEVQERIRDYYRRHNEIPEQFDKQPASGILKEKVLLMEQTQKTGGQPV